MMNLGNKTIDIISQKLYNICERGVFVNRIFESILTRIKQENYAAFSSSDLYISLPPKD